MTHRNGEDDRANPGRRAILAGALTALPLLAAAHSSRTFAATPNGDPIRDIIVINSLGGLLDMELPLTPAQRLQDAETTVVTFPETVNARAIGEARASGMTAVNITVGYVYGKADPYEHSVNEMGRWQRIIDMHSDDLIHVKTAADIRRAKREGKLGAILGFQNCAMLGTDASRVETFTDLGARVLQLTYNNPTPLGDGSIAPENRGLTPFGREVIERMNQLGVLADLSHSGERTCLDAAAASSQPIAITHTGCRALVDVPRNKTDDELRQVAERGGYVGIYFMPFLRKEGAARPEDVAAHIEHAINVCGEDHVGIGTDGAVTNMQDVDAIMRYQRDWVATRARIGIAAPGESGTVPFFVPGLDDVEQFRNLARLLDRRGHSWARIEKILGSNFLRVVGEVWKV